MAATPTGQQPLEAIVRARALADRTALLMAATRRLHHDCRNTRNRIALQRWLRRMRRTGAPA